MRAYRVASLTILAAALSVPATAFAQTWTDFQVGGATRRALVYVPAGIDQPPLLISLHGMGIPAGWNQGEMMKFEPIADREKFIVVYPEADQNLRWDLGGTHDIDFMLAIIDEMSARYAIDRNRVYASGFSMGGMFSYTLACKIPDKIAAIAPGNGYPLGGLSGCSQARRVPIFHMHGTADDFVAYSGIHAFLGTRVAEYGCPMVPDRIEPYPPTKPDSKSFKEYWGPCVDTNGQTSEIVLISVTGMIHDWATAGKPNANEDPEFNGRPFDIDGSEEAWAFLKTHSLDDSGPIEDADAGTPEGTGGGQGAGGAAGSGGGPIPSYGGAGGASFSSGGNGGGGVPFDMPATGGTPAIAAATGGTFAADPSDPEDDASAGCSCRVGRRSNRARDWSASLLGLVVALGFGTRRGGKD